MDMMNECSEGIDKFRVFPRLFLIFYIWYCYSTGEWFMQLDDPTTQQTSFATGIWGAAAVWFAAYANTGVKKP